MLLLEVESRSGMEPLSTVLTFLMKFSYDTTTLMLLEERMEGVMVVRLQEQVSVSTTTAILLNCRSLPVLR